MQGYCPKIHFSCRTSTFREVCNEIVVKFWEPLVTTLCELHINHFLLLPRFPHNVPIIFMFLSKWYMQSKSFVINSKMLHFTSDEIAFIVGLPNKGIKFEPGTSTMSGVTTNDIWNDIKKLDVSSPVENITRTFVMNINLILVPTINQEHWTLLVCNLRKKTWEFLDSLPKATHKAVAPEVVSAHKICI
ncbi:hypothetical protein MA16_Dca008412 [Dendrobium catenatum]|uniref:Ubiquitin-like protease family profile domain-containing protein n=1 Tax=Dendrobium catenatum TaxID=906689 RepID=A0A2I0VM51_9ASPA|nr:hypothetical protein MA16_Dca008412 [Dendrobium catenatum]